MNYNYAPTPAILLDHKKNRIRIHKQTLHLLGDPQYVILMVNPQTRMLAVCKSRKEDHLAQRIDWVKLSNCNCCEIYSLGLLQALQSISPQMSPRKSYRIPGAILSQIGVAQFRIDDSVDVGELSTDKPEVRYG